MANFTTSTPTTSDPSEIHGLLAVGTDNTGKLLDPDALAETATNLAYTASPTQGTITSDTGTDATIPAADGTNAGLFLPAEKTKLAGIAEGAEVNVQSDWNAVSGDAQILNKPTLGTAAATNSTDYATAAQGAKADTAVQPAALANYQPLATVLTNTTAAFTTAQETKLAGIAAGAEVNVNPDWNAVSGDAQIFSLYFLSHFFLLFVTLSSLVPKHFNVSPVIFTIVFIFLLFIIIWHYCQSLF